MLLVLASFSVSSLKVSDINVRLPFRLPGREPPRYIITAFDPTARWTILDSKLVTIQENPRNRYNSSITVEVQYEGPFSEAVTLIAKTVHEEVEMTVFLDMIHSALITTTARVLYANSSIDLFTVTAFDKSGNTFTSIDSYDVKWIYNSTEIRCVPLNETDLFMVYADGLPPNKILVQGQVIGNKPMAAVIENMVTAPQITLDIVEPIYLLPSRRTMLTNTNFYAKLCSKNGVRTNAELNKCKKQLIIPQKKFVFESENNSVASIEQNGRIAAISLGRTQIKVIDQLMPRNRGSMIIEVVNPTSIFIQKQYILVGQEPSLSEAIFKDYNGVVLDKPENINWTLTQNFRTVGEHTVTATAFGTSTNFIVITCEPPRYEPSRVYIPLLHQGYRPNLLGGSGKFTFKSINESIIKFSSGSIFTYELGHAQIIAHDENLNIDATLDVTVEDLVNPKFYFKRFEFMSGEEILYDFSTTTRSGRQFDFLEPYKVVSHDSSVVRQMGNLLYAADNEGFVNITLSITGYTQLVLISVYRHVQVVTIVQLTLNEPFDLVKRNGPLQWPSSDPPKISVECGSAGTKIVDDTYLILRDKYSGKCTLTIENTPTHLNPVPRPDSIDFTVLAEKIVEFAILVTDPQSLNNKESGLAPSYISPNDALAIKEVRIPSIHKCSIKVFAFAEGHKSLGEYNHPLMIIRDQSGNNISLSFFVKRTTIISVVPPPTVDISITNVAIHPIFNITSLTFLSIYQYAKNGATVEIFNGTGSFIIRHGEGANISGSSLVLYPSNVVERKVIVSDKFIPEYSLEIFVITEEPAKLEIDGPSFCIVGDTVTFSVHVYSMRNNEIQADGLEFTTETDGLQFIGSNLWSLKTNHEGRVEIIISSEGVTGSKPLDVLDQIKFQPDELTMFVGENSILNVLGGSVAKELEFYTANSSIANVVRGTLRAISPGITKVTAKVSKLPLLGTANLTVRVLEIRGININVFPDHPYVDSYIHLVPILDTDAGPQSPRQVSWSILRSDNWEKQYDGSVIIVADKATEIVATCSAHDFNHTITIQVDDRLKFTTPTKLSLPLGSNYTLKVANDIPVKYSVQGATDCSQDSLSISDRGFIMANNIGEFLVIARYRTQFLVTIVVVSKPATVYLQTESVTLVRPILLDIDGQEYSTQSGVNFDYNITNEAIVEKGRYTFAIDAPTYISVNAFNNFFAVTNSTLLSDSLLYPQSPIVLKGVELEFICAAKRPLWHSVNNHVLSVSSAGVGRALKRGRATVYCTDEISTPVTVVELQGLEIREREPLKSYPVTPVFSGSRYDSNIVRYPNDLQVTCSWDAPDCGRVYSINGNNISEAYCAVELFNRRLCPTEIHLKATASSRVSNAEVSTGIIIQYASDFWGVPSFIRANISEDQPSVMIPIIEKQENLRVERSGGLRYNFTNDGLIITADFKYFNNPERITLEYNGPIKDHLGERLEIEVYKDTKNSISYLGNPKKSLLDKFLFNISIILTCIFGFYSAYMLGQSGNLPALSPYKATRIQKK